MSFRELIRKKKALPCAECLRILETEKRGVLSVLGEGGYPYGMPMDHFYHAEDGRLYFHCGRIGHRLEALRACDKVSYCVMTAPEDIKGDWAKLIKSVIVFGRMEIVDDYERMVDITTKLCHKFTLDEAYIAQEIAQSGKGTLLLVLTPEHICGKRIEER